MRIVWIAMAGLALGCGGDKDDAGNDDTAGNTAVNDDGGNTDDPPNTVPDVDDLDPATLELDGACPMESDLGGFEVSVFDIYSVVAGSVDDGVVPVTILEEVLSEGDCELLKRNNPFCEPPCQALETCDFDGNCLPFPVGQDIGTVSIGGLLSKVVMEPIQPGNSYFDTQVPHPVFEPGVAIELQTTGGVYDPVTLHGVGVEPLVLIDTDWIINKEEDLTVTWEAPTGDVVRSRVHLMLNIDQHGLSPVRLFCEVEDLGTVTIPKAVIAALVDFGVTGFPNATVTRRTMDKIDVGSGCMDFKVGSPAEPNIDVAGYQPCFSDADCPPGQHCNLAIQICEDD